MNLLQEEKYEEAVTAFTEAIANGSKSDEPYIGRGDAYTALEKAEEALADYKVALNLRGSEKAYLGAVNAHILMNDFDAAFQMAADGCKTVSSAALDEKKSQLEKGTATDLKGREHKYSHYDSDGVYAWCHVTQYDKDGRITVKTAYGVDGSQISQIPYEYNENGDIVIGSWGFSTANSDGNLSKRENKYDEAGRLVEIINYGGENFATNRTLIEYGADGKKSRELYWSNIKANEYDIIAYEWTGFGKLSTEWTYGLMIWPTT
jgi:tetratricopeptide (TPR) repeat protein